MNFSELAGQSIETEIEYLRSEVERHNELYYQKAAPEIADAEFDALLARLKQLEAENPDLITPYSPTQRVGGRAEGFKPFVHRVPLMSLDNSYDLDDLKAFDERCRKLADGRAFDYVAELKIDGLSVALHYENGVLVAERRAVMVLRATTFSITSKRFVPFRSG
jgi:DNA ligase (NAD+)